MAPQLSALRLNRRAICYGPAPPCACLYIKKGETEDEGWEEETCEMSAIFMASPGVSLASERKEVARLGVIEFAPRARAAPLHRHLGSVRRAHDFY